MVADATTPRMPAELGRMCLDLAATVAERRGAATELLARPSDLATWLETVGPLDRAPALGERELSGARELREAIFRLVTGDGDGDGDGNPNGERERDVQLLNRLAEHATAAPILSRDARRREPDGGQSVAAALSAIARDAIELLGSPARARVRTCAGEDCGAPFLDTSRPGRRRWCYMGRCGNRAKKARRRDRSAPSR